jgi:hypothetical protein
VTSLPTSTALLRDTPCLQAALHGYAMLIVENKAHLEQVVAFARAQALYDPPAGKDGNHFLKSRLDYLASYGGKLPDGTDRMRVRLFKDFAPYSFELLFESRSSDGSWSAFANGALVWHGPHDGYGSGAAPTFAVTLDNTHGWSIHT